MIYIKNRVDSYQRVFALQKQREEVLGRLHTFLADYFWPETQISFVEVTDVLII